MSKNRLLHGMIALVLVAVVMFTIREAVATAAVTRTNTKAAAVDEMQRIQRAQAADAGRWNTQAANARTRQMGVVESVQRARAAEVARWNAQAASALAKTAREAERVQRVRNTETARLNAQAKYFLAKAAQGTR